MNNDLYEIRLVVLHKQIFLSFNSDDTASGFLYLIVNEYYICYVRLDL